MPLIAGLFLLAFWGTVLFLAVMLGFLLFPVALVIATVRAISVYCMQVSTALMPDSAHTTAPVGPPEERTGHDPAYSHYLVRQVWQDWLTVTGGAVPRMTEQGRRALGWASRTFTGGRGTLLGIPLWLGVCAGIVAAALPVTLVIFLVAAAYAIVVALGMLAWLLGVGLLSAIEHLFMMVQRILQSCPHPGCYFRFTLPLYECSTCGAQHRSLRPDLNGAFWHVCRCGTRLPTTIAFGRYRLQAYCPHPDCGRRLPARVGRVRIEPLPLVGGPGAGKTTFMAMTVETLHAAVNTAGGTVLFADKSDENAFRQLREELAKGHVTKTLPDLPKAVMLDVSLPGAGRRGNRILYLFDPFGEIFGGAGGVEAMRYLTHGEALVMVIDPFALPLVQEHLLGTEQAKLASKGVAFVKENPADTFTRLRNELATRSDKGGLRRVAIVITKADLLREITAGQGVQDDPAGWLKIMGLGNLVRELHNQGAAVRYYISGLPPDAERLSSLIGWLTELRLEATSTAATPEPATGDARAPWTAKARAGGRLPLSYLLARRGLAVVTFILSISAVTVLSLGLLFSVTGDRTSSRSDVTRAMAPQPTSVPKSFGGRWEGTMSQPGSSSFPTFTMVLVLQPGKQTGTLRYPDLNCSGSMRPQSRGIPGELQFYAEITSDPEDQCTRTGWIVVRERTEDVVEAWWYSNPSDTVAAASGELSRQ